MRQARGAEVLRVHELTGLPLAPGVTGAGCLLVVVLTHACEAFRLFPWMHWGAEHSVGHYVDLSSAVLDVFTLSGRILAFLAFTATLPTKDLTCQSQIRGNSTHTAACPPL
jgi:hypothetical protein